MAVEPRFGPGDVVASEFTGWRLKILGLVNGRTDYLVEASLGGRTWSEYYTVGQLDGLYERVHEEEFRDGA